ncbi:hypothetical protein ABE438_05500 [Bosea sp. TWI1241]|uniref:hypothetical protein n=1 Tax=Bosea sp. TWI1241 TaxID=3148904 RepID=UPI003209D0C7
MSRPSRPPSRRGLLAAGIGLAALSPALTARSAMSQTASAHPIVAFARDFGADEALQTRVAALVEQPPTTEEAIGFYGTTAYNATARSFLATVKLLEDAKKLTSIEDKYIYELLQLWSEERTLDFASLPEPAKTVFSPFVTGETTFDGEAQAAAYRRTVWENYARATEQIEAQIAAGGRVLLSIDATGGDTLFFALVAPEIAERWRDRALAEQDGYRSGVRSPMWDRFWDHLSYAARGFFAAEDSKGYPPGTRRRRDDIPFAQAG